MQVGKSITLIEIIILKCINQNKEKKPPSADRLTELVNDFIYKHRIPESHILPITNRYRFQQSIEKLRQFEMLTPEGKYCLSDKGLKFVRSLSDIWMEMPLFVPMTNNVPHLDKAYYLREY